MTVPIKEKIEAIVKKIYHGDAVNFTANAEKQIKTLTELGYDKMPICMAKTQYSFTDDQTKLGAPVGFTVTVRNIKVAAGAGFLVALTGEIMTMPGLPKVPAAERIDVDENGKISGPRLSRSLSTVMFFSSLLTNFCMRSPDFTAHEPFSMRAKVRFCSFSEVHSQRAKIE